MRFLFTAMDRGQGYLLRSEPAAIPAMTLSATLRDRRIILASLAFIAINLLAIPVAAVAILALAWVSFQPGNAQPAGDI